MANRHKEFEGETAAFSKASGRLRDLSENLYPSIPPDIQIRLDWFEIKNPTYALVTGASQGLGRVFARELAGRKQNVILVAKSGDKLKSLAIELLELTYSLLPSLIRACSRGNH